MTLKQQYVYYKMVMVIVEAVFYVDNKLPRERFAMTGPVRRQALGATVTDSQN